MFTKFNALMANLGERESAGGGGGSDAYDILLGLFRGHGSKNDGREFYFLFKSIYVELCEWPRKM